MQVNPMESKRFASCQILAELPFVGNLATARGVALVAQTPESFFAAANEFKASIWWTFPQSGWPG